MSEEIEERIKAYYIANDIDKILNYITNLQQKVEQLEKENNRLQNYVDFYEDLTKQQIKKYNQLENIRKEAINFVNENIKEDYYDTLDEYITHFIWNTEKEDLLNILNKGSDKDV